MKDNRTLYEKNVQDRNLLHYLIGLIVRWKQNFKYARARRIARKRGATIGEGVIMSLKLAKKANSNLSVGNHTSIQTDQLDMRSPHYNRQSRNYRKRHGNYYNLTQYRFTRLGT